MSLPDLMALSKMMQDVVIQKIITKEDAKVGPLERAGWTRNIKKWSGKTLALEYEMGKFSIECTLVPAKGDYPMYLYKGSKLYKAYDPKAILAVVANFPIWLDPWHDLFASWGNNCAIDREKAILYIKDTTTNPTSTIIVKRSGGGESWELQLGGFDSIALSDIPSADAILRSSLSGELKLVGLTSNRTLDHGTLKKNEIPWVVAGSFLLNKELTIAHPISGRGKPNEVLTGITIRVPESIRLSIGQKLVAQYD
jgi:hypothetical protein